ncbi:MAG TPA: hypothetical protein DDW27_20765 [Bacteroidales bacterium]|nr:hypothetical protein [Bacteroidales bacterium]
MYAILCNTGIRIFEELLTGYKKRRRGTEAQRHKGARAQRRKGAEAQWHRGAKAQGRKGIAAKLLVSMCQDYMGI